MGSEYDFVHSEVVGGVIGIISWDSPYFTAADLEIMRNAYFSLCRQDDPDDIQVEGRKFSLAKAVAYSYRPNAPDALL